MNVLVFGATGKTGNLVVERALAKGHQVAVLVRNPSKFTVPNVRVLTGDATNPAHVAAAVDEQDAIIESIGGTTPYKATHLESTSIQNILGAMQSHGVRRLIIVSMMGIGASRAQAPLWYKYLLMPTFLRGSTKDKTQKEQIVMTSGLDYTIVRPPILKDAPPTGKVIALSPSAIGHEITRADLADFLVDQLESTTYLGQAVTVVNK